MEPHEGAFLRQVQHTKKFVEFSKLLDEFQENEDAVEVTVECETRHQRAMVHVECKRRGLFSVRTTPEKVGGVCSVCKKDVPVSNESGTYYHSYRRDCQKHYDSTKLYCHIRGVVVSKQWIVAKSKGNERRQRGNAVRHKNRHARMLLIHMVLRRAGLPRDLRQLIGALLLTGDDALKCEPRSKHVECT